MPLFYGRKVGVLEEERALPYFRFFEKELAKISDEKLKLLEAPQENPAVPFEERNLFLKGEDKNYCQIGYGIAPNGMGFVCNETYMPGVRGEMLDWWFAWHSVGSDLRYKIWDPEDHYFARADKVYYVCNPDVPVNQKTWNVNHYVFEDIGGGPSLLKLMFKSPEGFGYDSSIVGTEFCESLVSAIGDGSCPAAMTHKWYPYKDGVLFCSRFWIGYGIVEGRFTKIIPEGVQVPIEATRGLFGHNIKEFTNLASILAEVYSENKDNF